MSLIQRFTSLFGGESSTTYEYQCLTCDGHFTSEEAHMARVSCPDCGSSDVRSVATEA
jgi:Zn finger protein HypA/HybF involved in hydrogenase expression